MKKKLVLSTLWTLSLERLATLLELFAILLILLITFGIQFVLRELPCPLCLLQRVGMIGILFGFLLNFRFGFRPSHYAIVLLSGFFTSFVALRQIALHVIPGTAAYGSAIFGLHLYTWSFIAALVVVVSTTLMLSVDKQYQQQRKANSRWRHAVNMLFILTIFIIAANMVSVILECGTKVCPDNPVRYEMLRK